MVGLVFVNPSDQIKYYSVFLELFRFKSGQVTA